MKDKGVPGSGLYNGLQTLAEYAFPKKCSNCGKYFDDVQEFLFQTKAIQGSTGLKQSIDDEERTIVELFRNCLCGSTLVSIFGDRRDISERGRQRREKFGKLLDMLQKAGLEVDVARQELLKILHGQDSVILKNLGFDTKKLNDIKTD